MPAKEINMHGKLYQIYDETDRIKTEAQKVAQEIRDGGKICFLNPRVRKSGTTYFIYVAERAQRKAAKKETSEPIDKIKEAIETIETHSKKTSNLKVCEICGKEFKPKNSRQKYCGKKSCKKAAQKK